jgi:hypothetical protein
MEDVLKLKKGQWKSSKNCLFKLCSIGPTLFVCLNFPLCLNFYLFVPLSPFSGTYLCILHVLGLRPYALFNESLIYQKKKEVHVTKLPTLINMVHIEFDMI